MFHCVNIIETDKLWVFPSVSVVIFVSPHSEPVLEILANLETNLCGRWTHPYGSNNKKYELITTSVVVRCVRLHPSPNVMSVKVQNSFIVSVCTYWVVKIICTLGTRE